MVSKKTFITALVVQFVLLIGTVSLLLIPIFYGTYANEVLGHIILFFASGVMLWLIFSIACLIGIIIHAYRFVAKKVSCPSIKWFIIFTILTVVNGFPYVWGILGFIIHYS